MAHISELHTPTAEHPQHLQRMILGGLVLRDTLHPQYPAMQYDIPQGISVDIPKGFPIAHMQFPDGILDMDTLKEIIVNAQGFHVPPSIDIFVEFPEDEAQGIVLRSTNAVVTQLLQFYGETHVQQGFKVYQEFRPPYTIIQTPIEYTTTSVDA